MPKQKKLFSVKNNDKNIDMNVDEALYNHFQSLSPLEKNTLDFYKDNEPNGVYCMNYIRFFFS